MTATTDWDALLADDTDSALKAVEPINEQAFGKAFASAIEHLKRVRKCDGLIGDFVILSLSYDSTSGQYGCTRIAGGEPLTIDNVDQAIANQRNRHRNKSGCENTIYMAIPVVTLGPPDPELIEAEDGVY